MIKQLIIVKAYGNRCRIKCLERGRGKWFVVFNGIDGFIGRKGADRNKTEGDGKTPKGLYPIGLAFGTKAKVSTRLNYMCITHRTRWCCNVDSRHYNTMTDKMWLKDCEDMWKYPREYKYGVVIEYNTRKPIRRKGSAIFMHCKTSSTAGCVAVSEASMKKIIGWLDRKKSPFIFIY